MSVLELALRRAGLSHGTVPKGRPSGTPETDTPRDALSCPNGTSLRGVPTGQSVGGTVGTLGTLRTLGTLGTVGTVGTAEDEAAMFEERAGLADTVPAVYHDVWARLNCQKPKGVTEADWRRALEDGGLFLDAFGNEAAKLGWLPGELFDVMGGMVWKLNGEPVAAIGPHGVRLGNGLIIQRRGFAHVK